MKIGAYAVVAGGLAWGAVLWIAMLVGCAGPAMPFRGVEVDLDLNASVRPAVTSDDKPLR